MSERRSIVEYFAEHEKYRCGYCGSKDTNYSHGLWAHNMTVADYQELIDRGWRRSGCYVYKPTMDQTCCPQYPIRCKALEFKLSKSQKKTIKRVNKYLNSGIKPATPGNDVKVENVGDSIHSARKEVLRCKASESVLVTESTKLQDACKVTEVEMTDESKWTTDSRENQNHPQPSKVLKKSPRKGEGPDPTKPTCKKAKLRRKEAKLQKHQADSSTDKPTLQEKNKCNNEKKLEDYLNEVVENPAHKLEIRLVRSWPNSQAFEDTFIEGHSVYKSYQMSIHKDSEDKPSRQQYTRFLCNSPLQIRLVRRNNVKCKDFEASLTESYKVFKTYQMSIHKETPEDCELSGYKQFLVDSPMESEQKDGGFADGFGSFHQQYILDGTIIAVGVIDILPHCVSSVYLYYNPEYEFLSLGTYSALRELAFTRYLHSLEPSIVYYYMGFYIHSCPKMRYKGNYYPSFLLCPETYEWLPIESCSPKLDRSKYSRFAEPEKVDRNGNIDLRDLLVLFQRQAMPYEVYKMLNEDAEDEEEVTQYGTFVGSACAKRMLLFRK